MRKSTKRKVWPLRNPALPLTDKHHDDLATALHVAANRVDTVDGCNAFTHQLLVATAAMEISGKHDAHSRNLLRTACIMLEKVCDTGKMDSKTIAYCQRVASWIDEWIGQGRITYASFTEAKRIAGKLEQVTE